MNNTHTTFKICIQTYFNTNRKQYTSTYILVHTSSQFSNDSERACKNKMVWHTQATRDWKGDARLNTSDAVLLWSMVYIGHMITRRYRCTYNEKMIICMPARTRWCKTQQAKRDWTQATPCCCDRWYRAAGENRASQSQTTRFCWSYSLLHFQRKELTNLRLNKQFNVYYILCVCMQFML